MNILFCEVCGHKIIVKSAKEFNYTEDDSGAFCDVCWFFVQRIESLEKKVARCCKEPLIKTGPSPYDAGVQRGCPHRPRYRFCACKQ